MPHHPTGYITFLFTDIEGSTKLAQKFPHTVQDILKHHHTIVNDIVESNTGYIFKKIGDAYCISFNDACDAVKASYDLQKKIKEESREGYDLKIRIGIHTGDAEFFENDYIGYITLTRVQRIMSVANGGQILLTGETYESLGDIRHDRFQFRSLGERRLKDLVRPEHVYQLVSDDFPSEFSPLKTLDARSNNLPAQTTSFIGREAQMKDVKDLLGRARLLTLIGPGGTGKTRLSLQTAANVIDDYSNGVWFVELARLSDPANIANEILTVLKISSDGMEKISDVITEFLKDKELLLVLDNCEHLIDECAVLCDKLLSSATGLKILATSRESMRINGEMTYQVPSLTLPDLKKEITAESLENYEAVKLFNDRARAVRQDFSITEKNAPALAELCSRLDGIPLAIELAAARIRILSVENILDKLNDRFKLLVSGSRNALPRQQTLRALIDWSYDLLSEKEKLLLQRLSVFSGGLIIESAIDVCADDELVENEILDTLGNLVDKSLVMPKEVNGMNRYELLETIRQYGYDKLTSKHQMHKNHFEHFFKMSKEKGVMQGMEQVLLYRRVRADQENLRAAINWSMTNDPAGAVGLANEMGDTWELNGNLSEGFELYKKIFGMNTELSDELNADAYMNAGYLASQLGDYVLSQNYLYKSLELNKKINDPLKLSNCLNNVGNLHFIKDEMTTAKEYHEEALKVAKKINDKMSIALSTVNLASIESFYGNSEKAYGQYEEGLNIFRELNDRLSVARILIHLGSISSERGDLEKSKIFYQECLPILRDFGDHIPLSVAIINLGNLSFRQEKIDEAELLYEEGLSMAKEYGYTSIYIHTLIKLADIELVRGNNSKAKDMLIESLKLCNKESDRHKLALVFKGLANYFAATGNTKAAIKSYGISMSFFESIGFDLSKGTWKGFQKKFDEVKEKEGEDKFNKHYNEGFKMTPGVAREFILNEKQI
ncbi:MAG: tetratricopeptide repeat protein [Ignavibacteria bacterium]